VRLIIGTRGSKLALAQSQWVAQQLRAVDPSLDVEQRIIKTRGDAITDRPLPEVGGKGFFTAELERCLIDGSIDVAVHSLKDLPVDLEPGLSIAAVTRRENPADVLVSRGDLRLQDLGAGKRVGTSSLRRRAQLLAHFLGVEVADLRGNIDTRLRKLDSGDYDAIVVAGAGLVRLGLADRISEEFPTRIMVPAAAQGALGIEMCEEAAGASTAELVRHLDHMTTRVAVEAERSVITSLACGCHAPVGVLATVGDGTITMIGRVSSPDGQEFVTADESGATENAAAVAESLSRKLIDMGGAEIIEKAPTL